jgi:hypothetical protein
MASPVHVQELVVDARQVNSLFRPLHRSRKAAAALIPIEKPMAAFSQPSSVWTNDINNHPKNLQHFKSIDANYRECKTCIVIEI